MCSAFFSARSPPEPSGLASACCSPSLLPICWCCPGLTTPTCCRPRRSRTCSSPCWPTSSCTKPSHRLDGPVSHSSAWACSLSGERICGPRSTDSVDRVYFLLAERGAGDGRRDLHVARHEDGR